MELKPLDNKNFKIGADTIHEDIYQTLGWTLLIEFGFRKDIVEAILEALDKENWLHNVEDKPL